MTRSIPIPTRLLARLLAPAGRAAASVVGRAGAQVMAEVMPAWLP